MDAATRLAEFQALQRKAADLSQRATNIAFKMRELLGRVEMLESEALNVSAGIENAVQQLFELLDAALPQGEAA